jgi:hypothetical protein
MKILWKIPIQNGWWTRAPHDVGNLQSCQEIHHLITGYHKTGPLGHWDRFRHSHVDSWDESSEHPHRELLAIGHWNCWMDFISQKGNPNGVQMKPNESLLEASVSMASFESHQT